MAHGDLPIFDESWRTALRVAETMTRNRGQIPTDVSSTLASHWDAGQIIEIVAVVGLFNYFNRFAIGLDIPPTK